MKLSGNSSQTFNPTMFVAIPKINFPFMKILILCTDNSCRSQMAEAFLHYEIGQSVSVGTVGLCDYRLRRCRPQLSGILGKSKTPAAYRFL